MINIKDLFIELSNNLVLLLALTFIYSLLLPKLRQIKPSSRSIIIGLVFGIIGIIGMYEPIQVAKGINIDGRVVITAISGAMGGFFPGIITGIMVGSVRMWIGGVGAIPGTGAILAGALTGALFFRYLRKGYNIYSIRKLTLLGVLLVIEGILATLTISIPLEVRLNVIRIVLIPLFILYPAGAVTLGLLLSEETKRRGKEK